MIFLKINNYFIFTNQTFSFFLFQEEEEEEDECRSFDSSRTKSTKKRGRFYVCNQLLIKDFSFLSQIEKKRNSLKKSVVLMFRTKRKEKRRETSQ